MPQPALMVDDDTVTPLERIRLSHDWSFAELGKDIFNKTHHSRNADCWRKICLGITPRPQARTQAILNAYLARCNGRRKAG